VFFIYKGHNLILSFVNNCETGIINFHGLMMSTVSNVNEKLQGVGE